MKSFFQTRIRFFSLAVILFALLLISRLYYLQIVHGQDFVDKADRQYVSPSNYVFDRGSIFFTGKDGTTVAGAGVEDGFFIAINPQSVTDAKGECDKLKAILPAVDCAAFVTKAAKPNDTYEEIIRQVPTTKAADVDALKLPGLTLYKDHWRVYPGGTLAAHVLGLLGYKGNDLAGRYGLESSYETTLKRDAQNVYVNFFAEIFSNINKTIIQREGLAGDIVTTIDPNTQAYLENELDALKTKWQPESVGGIIINPKNGEIYAMALRPAFDPNNLKEAKSSAVFSDDLIENVQEMGSVIKPLTMATAIDLGLVTASSTYTDRGAETLNGKTIHNFDLKAYGTIPLQEALGKSLNLGFVYLSQRIGHDNFRKYFTNFGLGDKTGIDLPNEGSGLVNNLKSPRDLEYANMSFGQGISITPIEAVRAISALANGGTLITPHLVKSINYTLGYSKTITYPAGKQVITAATSKKITTMLVEDFDHYFQNGASSNAHYTIAEKTGTAQIPLPGGGGYYNDRYVHTFFGYLPAATNPQFLVFMYMVYPKGVQYSSESLGPTFVDLTKYLISYYNIPPDR